MRFCVLECDNSTAWQPITFGDMFISLFKEEGMDIWEKIKIAGGDCVPNPEDYDGIVLTGSRFNCRDRESLPWFESVCNLIRTAYEKGSPRIYGGCFGCQVIAFALGGVVDYNPSKRFVLKAEDIIPVDKKRFAALFGGDSMSLKVIESHGDCVVSLPSNDGGAMRTVLVAGSESCAYEIFVAGKEDGKENIIACQSHPEFDLDYAVWQRIWPAVCVQKKRLTDEEMIDAKRSLEAYDRSQGADILITSIKRFLHIADRG